MKLSTVVLSSTVVLFGVAACAAPSGEEEEVASSSSQALCPKGMICQPPKTNWWGGIDPGQFTTVDLTGGTTSGSDTYHCGVDAGASFTCGGPPVTCDGTIAKTTTTQTGCDMRVRCTTTAGVTVCDCVPGCGGGGWSFGTFNPCLYGHTYTCDPSGSCRCN